MRRALPEHEIRLIQTRSGPRPGVVDWPLISDRGLLYTSIGQGRAQSPCPSALVSPGRCLDTQSQLQVPGTAFQPSQTNLTGDQFPVAPGQNFPAGAIPRNSFFEQGQKNVDAALDKRFKIRESMGLELRMELYNAFNRVTFGIPARTVNSTTPLGQISTTINLQNYVNSARTSGARMGQFAVRFVF